MPQDEKWFLIKVHLGLFLLQGVTAGAAMYVNADFAALNVVWGAAQAYFPNPWKTEANMNETVKKE